MAFLVLQYLLQNRNMLFKKVYSLSLSLSLVTWVVFLDVLAILRHLVLLSKYRHYFNWEKGCWPLCGGRLPAGPDQCMLCVSVSWLLLYLILHIGGANLPPKCLTSASHRPELARWKESVKQSCGRRFLFCISLTFHGVIPECKGMISW